MFDRELHEKLYKRFEKDVETALLSVADRFKFVGDRVELRIRIQRMNSYFFLCGDTTEEQYLYSLFGAICPSAAFPDFEHYIARKIPSISNYFEARHGLDNFVGKYVLTTKEHKAYKTIPAKTIVKITGISERGYDIEADNGDKVLEIGFTI